MKKYNLFTLLFIGGSLSIFAQPSITLEQYRNQVLNYSNQLKMSNENAIAAAEKFKMIRTSYFPSVGLSGNASYQYGNDISFGTMNMLNYNYNATLGIQQNIYTGGALKANTKSANIEYSSALVKTELTRQNVQYTADVTYWAYAASALQKRIAEHYVNIVNNLYIIVTERFNDGLISKTDLLMVETRLNEANFQNLSATQYHLNSLQNLLTLIGCDTTIAYTTSDSLTKLIPLESVFSQIQPLDQHPEYKLAEYSVDIQKQQINLAKSKYNPQLSIGLQGVFGTPSLNFTGDPKLYGLAFASLNIPIFAWGERTHNVSMSKASMKASEYNLEETKNQIHGDLNIASINLEQILKQSEIAQRTLLTAEENLNLNTFSYQEGRLPIIDVLQSQIAWIQAYNSYINVNYKYQVSVSAYYKAAGLQF